MVEHLIVIIIIIAMLGVHRNHHQCQLTGTGLTNPQTMFDKSDNVNLWIVILVLSHIIQDKYSIFNYRVRLV